MQWCRRVGGVSRRTGLGVLGGVALLALVAVFLVGTGVIPGFGAASPSPSPSPTPFPAILQHPTPGATSGSSGSAQPSTAQAASGVSATHPPAAFWRLEGSSTITLWRWRGTDHESWFKVDAVSAFFGFDTYRVLASPDGHRVAISERSNGQTAGRVRVFDDTGTLLWSTLTGTDTATRTSSALDLAWSADSTTFAFGRNAFVLDKGSYKPAPAAWTVVSFSTTGTPQPKSYVPSKTSVYRLLAFSADGHGLVGYDYTSYGDFWQKPVTFDLANGKVTALSRFPTHLSQASTGPVQQIDPGTGKALAQVGPANRPSTWAEIDGSKQTPLGIPGGASLAWTDDGRIAMGDLVTGGTQTNPTFTGRVSVIAKAGAKLTEIARLPAGHDPSIAGVRDGQALITTWPVPAASYPVDPGQSDAGFVDLGAGSVTFAFPPPSGPLFDGIAFAGWIAA
jgi:hypothetical protein